jgi:hypothetical protein
MARRTCVCAALLALAGCAAPAAPEKEAKPPPTVRKAECRWAVHPVRVNGVLDDVAWERAQVLTNFAVYWQKRKPRTATKAMLLWDANYLYFAAEMEDEDLYATVKERNGMTWNDDVFELFFKPRLKNLAYYEFQVNALNTRLELFLPSRGSGGYNRFAGEPALGMESKVVLNGTLNKYDDKDKGWTVEGRIPWTAFKATGGRPKAGARWRFALCRYDYSATLDRPELSSTAPLTQPDFHRYEDYGVLTFVGLPEE